MQGSLIITTQVIIAEYFLTFLQNKLNHSIFPFPVASSTSIINNSCHLKLEEYNGHFKESLQNRFKCKFKNKDFVIHCYIRALKSFMINI